MLQEARVELRNSLSELSHLTLDVLALLRSEMPYVGALCFSKPQLYRI
jgi:hypothetical protein